MAPQTISIIGAGISGLVLARSLQRLGVRCTVYERDTLEKFKKRHRYGITLHPWAYQALLPILGLDEATLRAKTAVDAPVGGTGRVNFQSYHGEGSPDPFLANRQELEQLLCFGVNVRWNHLLTALDMTDDAPSSSFVRLEFKKQATVASDVVVGADGVHSMTRTSMLSRQHRQAFGGTILTTLPYSVYRSRRTVSREDFDKFFKPSMKGVNTVQKRVGSVLLQVNIDYSGKRGVSISYSFSRPARNSHDPLFMPKRDVRDADHIPDGFYDELRSLGKLESPFREAFDIDAFPDTRYINWLMRSVRLELPALQRVAPAGVVLIGDSAHAMPIMGSLGANYAIKDALDLAKLIAGSDGDDLASFYDGRHETWLEAVEEGEARLAAMHQDVDAKL